MHRGLRAGSKMKKARISKFLLGTFWTGWRRWAAWSICSGAIFLLGALRSATERSSDRVARMGSDEFAVLLPEIGYDAAVEAGRKISIAVNAALAAFPPVKASLGIAWFGEADRLFPEMLKAADGLMYEEKESGKGDMRPRRFSAMNKSGAEK